MTVTPDAPGAVVDEPATPTDGRAARAVKTRQATVDGLLALLEEGDLQPTANRIAERAGISLRLIYHHFGDLESLFGAAAQRQGERILARIEPIDPGLPLGERLDRFCRQRASTLEWMTPVRRAALLHEPFSEELRRARDAFVHAGEAEVRSVFAHELDASDDDTLPALAMVTGWNAWDALRTSGSTPERAEAITRRTAAALLGA